MKRLRWKLLVLPGLLLIFLTVGQSFSQVPAVELNTGQDRQKVIRKNIENLNNRKVKYRLEAIEQLTKLKGKDDKENIGKALCNTLKEEKNVRVKQHLIDTLIIIKDKEAGGIIADALIKEKSKDLRLQMINALGNLEDENAVNILRELLESKEIEERLYAASSLAKMGDAFGIDVLEEIALDKDERRGRRSLAIRSLGEIKDKKAIDILEKILEEDDFALRLQAVVSLWNINTEEALALVEQMISDPDERVAELVKSILNMVKK